jgi:hypothetical protein
MFHNDLSEETLGEPFKASVEMTFKGSDVININAKSSRDGRKAFDLIVPPPQNRKLAELLDSSEKYKSNYMH